MVDYNEIQEKLKKEKAQTLEKLQQMGVRGQPALDRRDGSPFGKREEEADEAFELERRLALEERLRGSLAEIDQALQKYEAGTYGLCDSCGQPIEQARLEAMPQASLCMSCKANQAKNAKGAR